MCFGSSGDGGAAEARKREEERQARVNEGAAEIEKVFSQFDDSFFDKRRQAQMDYERPQIDDQYKDALGELAFALSRSGLRNSSVGATRRAKGAKDYNFQLQESAARGERSAADAKKAILGADGVKEQLLTNNMAIADPTAAANAAISAAQSSSALPKYEPLMDLFADLTEGLATQADLERRGKSRYQSGLFSPSYGGSGRTVG